MSTQANQTTAVARTEEKAMEFVPYGSQDKIRLSIAIIKNLIAVPTKSGKVCSDRDAMKFMMMCQARRLNPFEGDAFLTGYDTQDGPQFSLITAHQAFLKRAEVHPEFDGMTSGIIIQGADDVIREEEGDFHLPNEKVIGGWACVHFKNRKIPMKRRIRMERFNKGFAQWKVDAAGMICKCAEADALRSSFPTMLGGLYLNDEMDMLPKVDNVRAPKGLPTASTDDVPMFYAAGEKLAEQRPAEEPPAPGNEQPKPDPIPQLLDLMAKEKITEAMLLKHLREMKAVDESLSSLTEIGLAAPSVITNAIEGWKIIVKQMAAKKGEAK